MIGGDDDGLATVDTPVVPIDLDIAERNIVRFQRCCDEHGIAARPHIKTQSCRASPRRRSLPAPSASPARRSAKRK